MKEHILQFFKYEHLPARLQVVSAPFCELARALVDEEHGLPRNPERTVALRKLLEAKDAAVRAEAAEDEDAFVKITDAEAVAIGEACERYGLDPSYLHPTIIARLRALEKSRT